MATAKGECALCLVRVGELQLLFDPAEVRTIEGVYVAGRLLAEGIEPHEIDLRDGLQVDSRETRPESLIVDSPRGPLRFVVCRIEQILRSELREVYPLPTVLKRYGRRLGLRGVIDLRGRVAYLAAPADLGLALDSRQAAA